jgi:UDP-N-acetylglucosamine 2-epimerase
MKVMLIVGAQANFIKAVPILAAIQEHDRQESNGDRTWPVYHARAHLMQCRPTYI